MSVCLFFVLGAFVLIVSICNLIIDPSRYKGLVFLFNSTAFLSSSMWFIEYMCLASGLLMERLSVLSRLDRPLLQRLIVSTS